MKIINTSPNIFFNFSFWKLLLKKFHCKTMRMFVVYCGFYGFKNSYSICNFFCIFYLQKRISYMLQNIKKPNFIKLFFFRIMFIFRNKIFKSDRVRLYINFYIFIFYFLWKLRIKRFYIYCFF